MKMRSPWVQALLILAIPLVTLMAIDRLSLLRPFRLDLSQDQRHTLSPATLELLSTLEAPLHITLFISPDLPERLEPGEGQSPIPLLPIPGGIRDILAELRAHQPKIQLHRPSSAPPPGPGTSDNPLIAQAEQAGIRPFSGPTARQQGQSLIFDRHVIGLRLSYLGEVEVLPQIFDLNRLERQLHLAMARLIARSTQVISDTQPQPFGRIGLICREGSFCPFPSAGPLLPEPLENHLRQRPGLMPRLLDEAYALDSAIAQRQRQLLDGLFQRQGYLPVPLSLDAPIPADITAFLLIGTHTPLTPDEAQRLHALITPPARLALFISPFDLLLQPRLPSGHFSQEAELRPLKSGLEPLFSSWGLSLDPRLLVQPSASGDLLLYGQKQEAQQTVQQHLLPYAAAILPTAPAPSPTAPLLFTGAMRQVQLLGASPFQRHDTQAQNPPELTPLALSPPGSRLLAADTAPLFPPAALQHASHQGDTADGLPLSLHLSFPPPDDTPAAQLVLTANDLGLLPLSREAILGDFITAALSSSEDESQLLLAFEAAQLKMDHWQQRLGQIQHRLDAQLALVHQVMDWALGHEGLGALRTRELPDRRFPAPTPEKIRQTRTLAFLLSPLILATLSLGLWAYRRRRIRHIQRSDPR